METHVVYCSACDRKVRVVFSGPPGEASRDDGTVDPDGICVDYCRAECTGSLCPLFDLPPLEMLQRLRDSGFDSSQALA